MAEVRKNIAYELILDKIVNCDFAPGSLITEEQLVEVTGVSRTPVREAIHKLQENKLVSVLPKKGIKVSPITEDSISEIYDVRMLIEPFLIRSYHANLEKDALLKCRNSILNRAAVTSSDYTEDFNADQDLHHLLMESSRNQFFISMCQQMFILSHRMRIFSGLNDEDRIAATRTEHIEILDCLISDDFEKAALRMVEHLSNSKEATRRALGRRNEVLSQYGIKGN